ncbi:hypothetical protein GJ688_12825 [Heliobacillus mobilis]|uniref:Uncharacterized protein n=1 Tax=Heliobacterium mobile TaxID=28064 RepID=A0A6I3SM60_HELMO|nr:hypothetical protein [Heliobacterium mobile]MTV49856.1 hypothetical protein [Heliobacterium mobile]
MKLGKWEIYFSPHLENLDYVLVTNDNQQIKAYWKEMLIAHLIVVDEILSYQGVCRINILPDQNFVQLCLDDMEEVLSQLNN